MYLQFVEEEETLEKGLLQIKYQFMSYWINLSARFLRSIIQLWLMEVRLSVSDSAYVTMLYNLMAILPSVQPEPQSAGCAEERKREELK